MKAYLIVFLGAGIGGMARHAANVAAMKIGPAALPLIAIPGIYVLVSIRELGNSRIRNLRLASDQGSRPMTVIAIMAGLVPILWSHGTGSEVMQRIAVPMIGGMVSSTVLTLVVIPAIFAVVKGIGLAEEPRPACETAKVAPAMAP